MQLIPFKKLEDIRKVTRLARKVESEPIPTGLNVPAPTLKVEVAEQLLGHIDMQRMRYLGVLGILCEASVHVPEDIRESIEQALDDACEDGRLKWKRILDRFDLEVVPPAESNWQADRS